MDTRRSRFGDAPRAAGNDDAAYTVELIGAGVDWKNVALNTGFPDAPREQVTVLTPSVENCNAVHGGIIYSRQSAVGSQQSAVSANIAEGFGQQTDRQFVRYLFIARGSAQEARAHLAVARGRQYVTEAEATDLSAKYEEIARMATGLIKYLRASDRKLRG